MSVMTAIVNGYNLDEKIRERRSMSLALPGYERQSVWGVSDDGLLYAMIWRNDSSGKPDFEVEEGKPKLTRVRDLATLVALLMRRGQREVLKAMAVDITGWPDTEPDGTFTDKSGYPDQGDSLTITDVYIRNGVFVDANDEPMGSPRYGVHTTMSTGSDLEQFR